MCLSTNRHQTSGSQQRGYFQLGFKREVLLKNRGGNSLFSRRTISLVRHEKYRFIATFDRHILWKTHRGINIHSSDSWRTKSLHSSYLAWAQWLFGWDAMDSVGDKNVRWSCWWQGDIRWWASCFPKELTYHRFVWCLTEKVISNQEKLVWNFDQLLIYRLL